MINDLQPEPSHENDGMTPLKDPQQPRTLAWILIGIIAIGCGLFSAAMFFQFRPAAKSLSDLYFPSPTPTPTATPNRTATAQAFQVTSTAQAIQTEVARAKIQWKTWFADPYDSNTNDWKTGQENDRWADINYTVANGVYTWDVKSRDGFIGWTRAKKGVVNDFYLAVEIEQTAGSASDADYGLTFREDRRTNFYYFGIDNLGFHVSLSYNDEWLNIIDWTPSDTIRTNVPNRLAVIANGSHFIFLINDQVVGEADDSHIKSGTPGLAIQIYQANVQATFQFDNFEIRIR